MLSRDPLILPLVCRILTPSGLVDFAARLPRRGGVTLTDVPAEKVQEKAEEAGASFGREVSEVTEAGTDCPPPDLKDSESVTTTKNTRADGSVEVTTVTVKKVVNPDGSVTTTTTTEKGGSPPTTAERTSAEPGRPAGVQLQIRTENGAEFGLIRPLTRLRMGDVVQVSETYTDRYALRVWVNAMVQSPPRWDFYQHAGGTEFHNIDLDLLIVGAAP